MRILILACICLTACNNAVGVEPLSNAGTECLFKFNAKPVCTYQYDKHTISVLLITKLIAENEMELSQAAVEMDGIKTIQNISPDTSMLDGDIGIVLFDDINFDGTPDLAISTSFGVANQYFDYWVRDNASGKYLSLGSLPKLSLNKTSKTLEATVKLNAANYEKQVYEWLGNNLIRKK
jgi:hypothetical protein